MESLPLPSGDSPNDGTAGPIIPELSPQSFNLAIAVMVDGTQLVRMAINGVNGEWICFLDPIGAKSLAAQIEQHAAAITSGRVQW